MPRHLLMTLVLACPVILPACAAEAPSEVAEGSDDLVTRLPQLDPVRDKMTAELKLPVVFKVQQLREKSGFAFFLGKPLQASGAAIDYSKSKYKPYLDAGAFDDTCAALMKQVGGKWTLVTYAFGSTDAAWPTWAAKYKAPAEIFQPAPTATTTAASTERKAILDALRVPVAAEVHTQVLFQVNKLKILQGWAFLGALPVQADGVTMIDYHGTPYQQQIDEEAFDYGMFALLHQVGGKWTVVTYRIGATDIPYSDWASKYKAPASLFQ
jgi:hypothetical protein